MRVEVFLPTNLFGDMGLQMNPGLFALGMVLVPVACGWLVDNAVSVNPPELHDVTSSQIIL